MRITVMNLILIGITSNTHDNTNRAPPARRPRTPSPSSHVARARPPGRSILLLIYSSLL